MNIRPAAVGIAAVTLLALGLVIPASPASAATVSGITVSSVTTNDATVHWAPYPGATAYRFYWSTSPSMPSTCEPTCHVFTPADPTAPSTTLAEQLPTVVAGQTYYLKVSALSGTRTITSWQSTATAADLAGDPPPPPPPPPTTVQDITATSVTTNNATIGWTPYPGATAYRFYWSSNPSMPSTCEPTCHVFTPADLTAPSTTLAQQVSTVVPGQIYYLKVSALKGTKTISKWQSTPTAVDLVGDPPPASGVLEPIADNGSGTSAKATVTFTPVANGQATELQVLTIATSNTTEVTTPSWKKIASGKQDSAGRTTFTISNPLEVEHSYRAVTTSTSRQQTISNEVRYAASRTAKNTGLSTIYLNTNEGHAIDTRTRYFEGEFSMTASSAYPECGPVATIPKSTAKGRGNYSWSFSKKSYTLKLDKKTDLCGMGKSKKWALIANAYDKSLLRGVAAFNLGSKLDHMAWTPKARPVDLYVNGTYLGSYSLVERISIETQRVNIDELKADGQETDPQHPNNVEPNVSGGYLLEWDFRHGADVNVHAGSRGWVGIKDPEHGDPGKDEGISPQQVSYINNYLDKTDSVLFGGSYKDPANGWRKYIDEASAVDYYIAQELMKPVDGNMWASVYMYKPRNGKLFFGPMWDYDLSSGSAKRQGNTVSSSGWYLRNKIAVDAKQSSETWFNRLNQDSSFRSAVAARWKQVYPQLKTNDGFLGEQQSLLARSAAENFKKWSVKEQVSPAQVVKGSWSSEVSYLRAWLRNRIAWMNGQY